MAFGSVARCGVDERLRENGVTIVRAVATQRRRTHKATLMLVVASGYKTRVGGGRTVIRFEAAAHLTFVRAGGVQVSCAEARVSSALDSVVAVSVVVTARQ
jgi:hypothetical protein